MRLTTPEVAGIIDSCKSYCQNKTVELRLYGHRVSDYDQGDDIGLMLIAENDDDQSELEGHKVSIIASVVEHVGDYPVEVLITTREGLRTNEKAHDLLPDSMFLHTYYKDK